MLENALTSAASFVPESDDIAVLRDAASVCRGCDLYANATRTVFGEGSATARLMIVGEQPGDRDDIEGHPLVGPAGRLLDSALVEVGIDRADVYITNAVKHFKFIERGKRRIHQTPRSIEIRACAPWLTAEIAAISPEIVLALGATASHALLGSSFRVTKQRGAVLTSPLARVVATVHPASILRIEDPKARALETRAFIADLRVAAENLN